MRILVIEDEPPILDFVVRGLSSEGFDVAAASDGLEGEQMALADTFDLVVLDLMLPGRPGMAVLAAIREHQPWTPVILLTARAGVDDRVAGLSAGATDYLVKPFAFAELVARVRTHLRTAQETKPTLLRAADLELDLLSREARRAGETVQLTDKESDLLAYFLHHPDRIITREQLWESVWGYEHNPRTNVAEVYVGYLRRKLRRPGLADPIVTVRSVGYRLKTES